jgi:hypothetical protein
LIEPLEQRINQLVLLQGFTKRPYGAGIGHVPRQFEPQKAHEGEPVADWVLQSLIREVVESLQNQELEHEDAAGWLAPRGVLSFLDVNAIEQGTKQLPVNDGVQTFQ